MNKLFAFLPLAIIITLLSGGMYIAVQQNYRLTANDIPLQLAEDTARNLEKVGGVAPSTDEIDIDKSIATFVVIYDRDRKPVTGNGKLNGKLPTLPVGVFDFADKNGKDKVTWQPQSGVRVAVVVAPYKYGYVMSGKNLREVEKREDLLLFQVGSMWFVTLIATFIAVSLIPSVAKPKKNTSIFINKSLQSIHMAQRNGKPPKEKKKPKKNKK